MKPKPAACPGTILQKDDARILASVAGALLIIAWCLPAPAAPPEEKRPPPTRPVQKHDPARHRRELDLRQRRVEQEYQRRAFPAETIPEGAMERAQAQARLDEANPLQPRSPAVYFWYNIGPAPIKVDFDQPVSGRVTSIAVDPSNPTLHWLIGAAQGGVWETMDAGNSWVPRTDDQDSLAMGAIAFAPSTPSRVYAGTGEPNFSGDSYAGAGLLVSYDGGTNWQMLNNSFAQTSVSSIKVDPNNANRLTLSTVRGLAGKFYDTVKISPTAPARGVFVSTNGGTIFTRLLTGEATDLAMDPYQFNRQYAALGDIFGAPTNGLYRTTNGWSSYERIDGPWTGIAAPTNYGRIALAVAPSSAHTVYAGISFDVNSGGLVGIWRSDNAWDPNPTWTNLPNPSIQGIPWYAFALQVDQNDASTLYMAEFTLQRYTQGFWQDVAGFIHPDHHAMAWVPFGFGYWNTPRLLLGNDGGIWFSTQPVSNLWYSLNGGKLSISQIWKGAVDPRPNYSLALAGTQDNGNVVNQGNLTWHQIQEADGSDCAISSVDPDNYWATSWETLPNIHIYRTQDAGTNLDLEADGIEQVDVPFFVHFEKSPRFDNLFLAGTAQLWRCTNFFDTNSATWYSNSPIMLRSNGAPIAIGAIAFAPSDTNGLIYAFGTDDGQLRMTTNGGNTWYDLDPTNGVPGRAITALAFGPTDANVLYATLSGFDESTPGQAGHLFKTANALSVSPGWQSIGPSLNLPHNCLAIDPFAPNTIFLGTDLGIWYTSNGGGAWTHHMLGLGMPNVAVFDLRMNSVGKVTAFTHGRGAFTYALGIPVIEVEGPIFPIDIACLTCPPINWLNPGDLVSVELPLHNESPIDTIDLTATMLATPGITPYSSAQHYGVVQGQGLSVKRNFTFKAGIGPGSGPTGPGTSCGDTVQVVLQLQDQGSNDLGQVTIPFRLGHPLHPLVEDFEEAPIPTLPANWDSTASGTCVPWATTTNSPPDGGPDVPPDFPPDEPSPNGPPTVSIFTPAPSGSGQSSLYSAPFTLSTTQAELYFRHGFDVSNAYDGCVLEIAIGPQPFQDILSAGGSFALNGYDFTLRDNNPLGPRRAWSGHSGGWLPVQVNLPAAASGQSVQLRWHFATSRGLTNGGWYVDSVAVTEPQCLPPVGNPVILNPRLTAAGFTFTINTVTSRTYIIEFKTNIDDPSWQVLQTLPGNGNPQDVTQPNPFISRRFFRFVVQ